MRTAVLLVLTAIATAAALSGPAHAQRGQPAATPGLTQRQPAPAPPSRTPAPAAAEPMPEIKLDENTTLRAAALEARISAVLANFALLQRQAQDLQQEMARMLEERKALIQDAGRKATVEVKDPNEWAFDNKNQRYVKVRRQP